MEKILKTAIELEKDEVGLEITKTWGLITLSAGDLPPLYTHPPFDLFILLDAGITMQGDKIRGVKEAIISLLSRLNEKHTFSLVVYNYSLELIISFMVCTPENIFRIIDQLDKIISQSSANHYLGMRTVFDLITKSTNPVLFFFSSGLSDEQHYQAVLIKEIVPPRGCIFNVIGVGTAQNSSLLYGISHYFRGVYHYAPTPLETFRLANKCMNNVFSTLAKEIVISLECFDGCRLISWSTSSEIIEKNPAKTYDIHINACAANETRTFVFALSLKSMTDLEKVDPKTGKMPIIWFIHPLVSITISYLNVATGNRESITKNLSALRVKHPGYFPLSMHIKNQLERLEAIEMLNKYIKNPDPVLLTQLPEGIKKDILMLKGLHKNHLVCSYVSSHFFEKFI